MGRNRYAARRFARPPRASRRLTNSSINMPRAPTPTSSRTSW
jgi:hypothetical protein